MSATVFVFKKSGKEDMMNSLDKRIAESESQRRMQRRREQRQSRPFVGIETNDQILKDALREFDVKLDDLKPTDMLDTQA